MVASLATSLSAADVSSAPRAEILSFLEAHRSTSWRRARRCLRVSTVRRASRRPSDVAPRTMSPPPPATAGAEPRPAAARGGVDAADGAAGQTLERMEAHISRLIATAGANYQAVTKFFAQNCDRGRLLHLHRLDLEHEVVAFCFMSSRSSCRRGPKPAGSGSPTCRSAACTRAPSPFQRQHEPPHAALPHAAHAVLDAAQRLAVAHREQKRRKSSSCRRRG